MFQLDCSMPVEYCEFSSCFDLCVKHLEANFPEIFEIAKQQVSKQKKQVEKESSAFK